MNRNIIGLIAIGIISITALTLSIMGLSKKSVCFIDNSLLMKDFKMTKDLESQYRGVNGKREELLDSMKLEVEVLERKIKAGEKELVDLYKNKVIDYQVVFEKFQKDDERITADFNEQVVKQLNQYIKEYGQEHHIDYILGANGTGSLLFASEKYDITKEVLKYVNHKYSGKK